MEDKIINIEDSNTRISEDIISLDLNEADLVTLISILEDLYLNVNPYSVGKDIEKIKSVFYQRLKRDIEHYTETDINKEERSRLDAAETQFKEVLSRYRKKRANFRRKKEEEEKDNLRIKMQIIKDIDKITQEEESLRKTFEEFRNLQDKWRNTGNVPIIHKNNLWQSYHHHIELFYDFIKLNKDLRDLDFRRNLEEKTEICEKAEHLLKQVSLQKTHDTLQELHEHWKNVGPVKREQREGIWLRFQDITRKLNQKRNTYFIQKKEESKKRLNAKNKICKKINSLTKNIPLSHKEWKSLTIKCNELESEWRKIGVLNKLDNKSAWKNLRSSLDVFYDTRKVFYKNKKTEKKEIISKKTLLCEKAENLKNNLNWEETTNKFIQLQEEWKLAGYSSDKETEKIWKRFKNACDTFFSCKKDHFKKLNLEKKDNLKQKTILFSEIKSFIVSKDKEADIKSLKEFTKKLKKIGPIAKEKLKLNDNILSLIDLKYQEIGVEKEEREKEKYKTKIDLLRNNKKLINKEKQVLQEKINSLRRDISKYENNISFLRNNKKTEPLIDQTLRKIKELSNNIAKMKQKLNILN